MEVCGQLHIPEVLSLGYATLEPIIGRVGWHQHQFGHMENYLAPGRSRTTIP
jgi:hypothetical protein